MQSLSRQNNILRVKTGLQCSHYSPLIYVNLMPCVPKSVTRTCFLVQDVGLAGMLSLLTAVLLHTTPSSIPPNSQPDYTALPHNFCTVAEAVLRLPPRSLPVTVLAACLPCTMACIPHHCSAYEALTREICRQVGKRATASKHRWSVDFKHSAQSIASFLCTPKTFCPH